MTFNGVEVDNARQAATQMENSATAIFQMATRLDLAVTDLVWEGQDAKGFRDDWTCQFAEELVRTVTALADNARGIREALAAQQRVSGQ